MNPTLEITVMLPCANYCLHCPQELLMKNYKGKSILSYNDFETILKKIPKTVRIDWSGFCEPFHHGGAVRMMKLADEQGYKQVLYTTLSGINPDDIDAIKGIKFELIMIHCPDLTGFKTNEAVWSVSLAQFLDAGFVPQYMAMGEVSEFVQTYATGSIQHPWMLSRGGNINNKIERKTGKIRCNSSIAGADFDHNVMLPNGDVYLCCMDYGLTHFIGNISTWEKEDFGTPPSAIKVAAESEGRKILCRHCEWGELC